MLRGVSRCMTVFYEVVTLKFLDLNGFSSIIYNVNKNISVIC